jgi:uncharacterized repeat protein (TIGR01451 family)
VITIKTKLYAVSILMLLLFSYAIVFVVPSTRGEQPSWPTSWVLADTDPNEAESNNDYRDVHNAYYYDNNEYLYFRLECYGSPNFTAEPNTRFKWFIDTDDPYNMAWQGGNVYEDDFLLFIEGPQGAIYLLHDVDGNGLIGDDYSDYETTPGPITDTSIAGYRITSHCIDIYIRQAMLGNPTSSYFTWATDQGDPNLDSTSTNDRSNSYWQENLLKADLGITITDNPDPVHPGNALIYTLQVTNHGPHNAAKASVKNMLPDGVTFINAVPPQGSLTGQTAWWNFTSLAIGASEVITINVIVHNDPPFGVMTDTAIVYNDTRDPLPGNNIASEDTTVCQPPDTEPPSIVTGLTVVDAKDGKLNLSWDPATDNVGVDHYEIYRDGLFLIKVNGTIYQNTGLVIDQEYVYKVRAVDAAGNKGGFSDPESGVSTATADIEPPSTVTGLTVVDAKDGKLNLSWDPATDNVGVDHYEIYRNESFLVNVTSTTYQDIGLMINHEYVYEIRAVDAAGNTGGFSDPVSGTSTKTPGGGGGSGGGENNQGSNTQNTTGEENNTSGHLLGSVHSTSLSPPRIDGPLDGYTNISYTFDISSNDSDITLKYTIMWGDGYSNESNYLENGSVFIIQHQWIHPGVFSISATASDGHRNATSHTAIIIRTPPSVAAIPTPNNYLPWIFDFLLILLILLLAYLLIRRALKGIENRNKK